MYAYYKKFESIKYKNGKSHSSDTNSKWVNILDYFSSDIFFTICISEYFQSDWFQNYIV